MKSPQYPSFINLSFLLSRLNMENENEYINPPFSLTLLWIMGKVNLITPTCSDYYFYLHIQH